MPNGHVLIIHPDERITVEDTLDGEPRLGQLQKAVDGYVEVIATVDTVAVTTALASYMDMASVRRLAPLDEGTRQCLAYCNEEGKAQGRDFNLLATKLWAQALVRSGEVKELPQGGVAMTDFLVGPIALLIGDKAIEQELEG